MQQKKWQSIATKPKTSIELLTQSLWRASCQKSLQQLEKETQQEKKMHKKRAEEYTKTEATELKELDDKNSCGRKKELGIPQKQQRYNLQRYAEL